MSGQAQLLPGTLDLLTLKAVPPVKFVVPVPTSAFACPDPGLPNTTVPFLVKVALPTIPSWLRSAHCNHSSRRPEAKAKKQEGAETIVFSSDCHPKLR